MLALEKTPFSQALSRGTTTNVGTASTERAGRSSESQFAKLIKQASAPAAEVDSSRVRPSVMEVQPPMQSSFIGAVEKFTRDWNTFERSSDRLLTKVSSEYRPYLEIQLLVNRLSIETQLVTKAGETASATLRSLQQMGNS